MNLIEIACPADALDDLQRHQIAESVLANFLVEPDAPPQAIERAARATHVWFRDARTWTGGAGRYHPAGPIPFAVTITVPEAWREDLSRHAMAAVRTALIRHVPADRFAAEATWINVVGIADGSIGMNGKPTTSADIVRYLTQDVRPTVPDDLPHGVTIDPVCGMRVHLGKNTITLQHDGRTIGFCATGCRDVYAADHHISLAS